MAVYWKICAVLTMALFANVFAQRNLPGGWQDADENSKGVQDALQIAKDEFNKANTDEQITTISKVYKIKKQVVAGMKYLLDVQAVLSSCKESSYTPECPNMKTQSKRCTFTVLIVPWQKTKDLLSSRCR
ncbi:cystatin-C-like [Pseudophryne corroboree]|uniref:cystatin-C-like n=1 Tax=Pseudophryne corroboree TaxID=495146 RepID=UPI0030817BCE